MAGYTKDIYEGGADSFSPGNKDDNPDRLFTGYRVNASSMGLATGVQTANQIKDINTYMNQGVVPIEMGTIDPNIFDQIPKQQFKEIGRLAKLNGVKISVHAPIQGVEPSGLDPQGSQWTEQSRLAVENRLKGVINKSFDVDAEGGVPITIHASTIPISLHEKRDGEIVKTAEMIVNRDTGQFERSPAIRTDMYRPSIGQVDEDFKKSFKKIYTPEDSINSRNATVWSNSISEIVLKKEKADEILREIEKEINPILREIVTNPKKFNPNNLPPEQQEAYQRYQNAQVFLEDLKLSIGSLFGQAYKLNVIEENNEEIKNREREDLDNLAKNFKKNLGIPEKGINGMSKEERRKMQLTQLDLRNQSHAVQNMIQGLGELNPEIYVSATDFVMEKSSDTFANIALHSYRQGKEKKKDPSVISLENWSQEAGIARGEDMKKIVDLSREKLVQELIEKEKVSKSHAEETAKKIIGITFDVGHINQFKKHGFTDEDLIKEAEKLKGYVKHVHIADNFGYEDSHLPPGMGNVPIKDLLQAAKAGDEKARTIVESGPFFGNFGESSFIHNLEGMGSPMFTGGGSSSYWGQSYFAGEGTSSTSLQRGYFGGYGGMLPQISYETFGAGFSQLPAELGGSRQGNAGQGSRMSGKPME